MKSNDITILILSCDKYADLWKPFIMQFKKNWPDCPYPVVLGSNTILLKDKNISTILSGPDRDWSASLIKILEKIRTRYVFLWLEDIFPISRVNTHEFKEALKFMKKKNAKHMHVYPVPKPDRILEGGAYGEFERGAPYRATGLGFWDTSYLSKLLLPGENPWNFEIMGSYRTSYSDGFYCLMKPLFSRLHVVEKGYIFPDAYAYCQTHKIPLDMSRRSLASGGGGLRSLLQSAYFNTLIHIPWKMRTAWMNLLRRLLISY